MEDEGLNTFQIKLSILSILGESATKERGQELYDWVMQELELKTDSEKVTTLKTVQ